METEIMNISATTEIATALKSAAERGLAVIDSDFDAANLRWWRDTNGTLYATAATVVEPAARRVELELDRGAGYRAAD